MKIQETICQKLTEIEHEKNVRILFASESGSRAWGFPSQDSDYDVRFIYAQEPDWYLSVEARKDVIEIPIDGDMDMGGWDVRKSFALMRKCNCALIEWLSSPIVYSSNHVAIAPLKEMIDKAFLSRTACHHYLALASRKTDEIMQSDQAKLKAYFYALRAILCAKYIVDEGLPPPMSIDPLLGKYFEGDARFAKIEELRKQKLKSTEKDSVDRVDWLDQFLVETQMDVENRLPENNQKAALEEYDEAFRKTLKLVWKK